MIKRKHIRVTTHYATKPRKIFIAAAAFFLIACGAATPLDAVPMDGSATADAGKPLDAGLSADARLEDCLADGVRMCGTKVGCFENGPNCDCRGEHIAHNVNPEVGWCTPAFPDHELQLCISGCRDGDVCVRPYATIIGYAEVCLPESVGRMMWLHGQGSRVTYADGAPYTGEPIPVPETCRPPDADLRYCGGNCGGCSVPNEYCSGRSPTHPWGICVSDDLHCYDARDCNPAQSCLHFATPAGEVGPPTRCLSDCARIAANVPGGARCR